MKLATVLIGFFGFVFAIFTALYLQGGFTGQSVSVSSHADTNIFFIGTLVLAALGLLAAVLVYFMPRVAAWTAGIVTVAGAFTSGALWLGAGSFFFVVSALAYSIGRGRFEDKE